MLDLFESIFFETVQKTLECSLKERIKACKSQVFKCKDRVQSMLT